MNTLVKNADFTNPKKVMAEMARVLKKDGVLIISDVHVRPLFLSNLLFKVEPGFVKMYSLKGWKGLYADAGFRVMSVERVGVLALRVKGKKR